MSYLHGAYGTRTASQVQSAVAAEEAVLYVGTAPINLIRGYADADLVNMPIKISNLSNAYSTIGYSEDWDNYTLNEVVDYHFNNTLGNIGPIYIINVLDPDTHRKSTQTTQSVSFTAGKATFTSTTIILDTFAIDDKTEGTDYELSYDMATGTVTIDSTIADTQMTGSVTVAYYEIDSSAITYSDIVGSSTDVTGLQAIKLLYNNLGVVCNMLAAPGWSDIPAVYSAMVTAAQKINGHWDAFVLADIPLSSEETTYSEVTPAGTENPSEEGWYELSGTSYVLSTDTTVDSDKTYYEATTTTELVDTIALATSWKETNGYESEISKVCWPKVKYGTKIYHLSTVAVATMLKVDNANDSIPYETASNKKILATGQYFGPTSTNKGYDIEECNDLNKVGITTIAYWEGNWKLWGGHTAAYTYGDSSQDAAVIFDTNIRMLMHITNGFQQRHGTDVDTPLTLAKKESIRIEEQQYLDILAGIGALIGDPQCLFIESENSTSDMVNGDFVWNITCTITPQLKSATAKVTYTDEGFSALFGEEA